MNLLCIVNIVSTLMKVDTVDVLCFIRIPMIIAREEGEKNVPRTDDSSNGSTHSLCSCNSHFNYLWITGFI